MIFIAPGIWDTIIKISLSDDTMTRLMKITVYSEVHVDWCINWCIKQQGKTHCGAWDGRLVPHHWSVPDRKDCLSTSALSKKYSHFRISSICLESNPHFDLTATHKVEKLFLCIHHLRQCARTTIPTSWWERSFGSLTPAGTYPCFWLE